MLISQGGAASCQELNRLGSTDDCCVGNQVILIQFSLFEAGRTDPDCSTRFREIIHEFFERGKALFMDIIGVALLGKAHAFCAEKNDRFNAGCNLLWCYSLAAHVGAGRSRKENFFTNPSWILPSTST